MPRESKANRKKRTAEIFAILKREYPDAKCSLEFSKPLELLVATILSAQCTDKQVNIVTAELFRKYRKAADYAKATQAQLEADIRRIGLFRNKSKNLKAAGQMLVEEFGGRVPKTMAELTRLPGVARKTANVVLGNAFGVDEGIVVDTHVARLAGRLRLSRWPKARGDKIEQDLMELVPQEDWAMASHWLVFHGRAVCSARKPKCDACPIAALCPSAGKV